MIAPALLACSLALLAAPSPSLARHRFRRLLPAGRGPLPGAKARSPAPLLALSAGAAAFGLGGWPAGAVLAIPCGAAAWLLMTRRRASSPAGPQRLAATWDLLAACLRAGLPVPTAVEAVAGGAPGEVANALRAAARLLAMGADPAEAWAPAAEIPETAELARAARRTARSGAALASVAADLAARARARLSDEAEARAQRAGVLITGPLGLCFLPAFLCLGVVPVVIGLAGTLTIPR
ncbi:type II secretion system F family protein [Amycolatopsis minnesotensis]|uniref:Type II secretion system F family protein n=1 Tax=Amycolatopsis minnesotensis TaxID=337894 RepID=A0ABP5BFZ6_9PSEU